MKMQIIIWKFWMVWTVFDFSATLHPKNMVGVESD